MMAGGLRFACALGISFTRMGCKWPCLFVLSLLWRQLGLLVDLLKLVRFALIVASALLANRPNWASGILLGPFMDVNA